MQSGRGKTTLWVLEYETVSQRKPESLVGGTSREDTLNKVQLKFESCEAAVAFAEKKGWDYAVAKDHERKVTPRNYGDNFKYIPAEE